MTKEIISYIHTILEKNWMVEGWENKYTSDEYFLKYF